MVLVEWLATPKFKRSPSTQEALASKLGINRRTIIRWKQMPELRRLVLQRAKELHTENIIDISSGNKKESRSPTQVYIIQEEHGLTKIGRTKNFTKRLQQLSTIIPYKLSVIAVLNTELASKIELELHKRFAHRRVTGEWFDLNSDEVKIAVDVLHCLNDQLSWIGET